MMIDAFKPFVNSDSEILILGSFPSVKSREENFFYGNKLNRFWKTLTNAFNESLPLTISEKKSLLKRHKIALWDIVSSCEIVGSLDSKIKHAKICDLTQIYKIANIKTIITNGKTAKKFFEKAYPNLIAINLPSTSPANTRFDEKVWIDALNGKISSKDKSNSITKMKKLNQKKHK